MELKSARLEAEDLEQAVELMYERGWTDGLPVVPPTVAAVVRMLDRCGRDPQQVVGIIPPKGGIATVEKVAINCVMAGCRPEFMPVVIAAIQAMLEPRFNLNGVQTTTHCVTPLTIVSGPIVKEFGFNCGDGVFGGGSRANATVGRAIRLILWNIGGAYPGQMARSTQGHPGKYTFCIAENQDANPWEPIHVERGLRPEQSAVTVFGCEAPHSVMTGPGDARIGLICMADTMATKGNNNMLIGGEMLLVVCPKSAAKFAAEGYTKASIRQYLFENARKSVGSLKQWIGPEDYGMGMTSDYEPHWSKWAGKDDDNAMVPVLRKPENLLIVVAGGWGGMASLCSVLPGWGHVGGYSVTKAIELP